ncbi:MAG TPA: MBL fold metallo-hydrolase, partial [Solirubrobacterales bacterium]|nr:MBL fold metallo-hydrolase [Solirubrobacterales bacterium]
MRVEWHGQSAFTLSGNEATVAIDPFGDVAALRERGIRWEYAPVEVPAADLVLVTHEHRDHNAVEVVGGEPAILRSQPGRHESPLGEVVGVASEHDEAAGTQRGANTIFAFAIDGLRVAHFGDFGQSGLRAEQRAALGEIDLLFLPVGGGPTIGGEAAAQIARELAPRWAVPMHYRTERIGFLETEEEFVAAMGEPLRLPGPWFETDDLPGRETTTVVVP